MAVNAGANAGQSKYFDNPQEILPFSVEYQKGEDTLHDGLKHVAKSIVAGWTSAKNEDIRVIVVTGGITNILYKLEWSGKAILVRLYGENTELFIDKERDNRVFAFLSAQKFAPTYYGRFTNGRVEGWFEGRALEPKEMAQTHPINFPKLIAAELARLHQQEPPEDKQPQLFPMIRKFARLCSEVSFDSKAKQAVIDELQLDKYVDEIDWLEQKIFRDSQILDEREGESGEEEEERGGSNDSAKSRGGSGLDSPGYLTKGQAYAFDVVFCHNDLLSGNLMHADGLSNVQVLDFEYGCYNFRGYDIANHFCEYCGFEFHLERFPSFAAQRHFVREYFNALSPDLLDSMGHAASEQLIREFCGKLKGFFLASHLFWGLWAIVQEKNSPIDFDFLSYAQRRLGAYQDHKPLFI